MAWAGLVLQGAGAYLGGEADKKDARTQADLGRQYQTAYNQYSGWQKDADEALAARMHGLAQQGYGNYQNLGHALGSPARGQAGMAGAAASGDRLRAAMSGVPAITGQRNIPSSGFGGWAANTTAQRYAPLLRARTDLINQQAGQRAMTNYDRSALGQAADASVDLGRQAAEAQQRENALAAYRRQILEQAQSDYQYKGPGPGYYDAKLYAQGLNLAGSAAMSYGQNSGPQTR